MLEICDKSSSVFFILDMKNRFDRQTCMINGDIMFNAILYHAFFFKKQYYT